MVDVSTLWQPGVITLIVRILLLWQSVYDYFDSPHIITLTVRILLLWQSAHYYFDSPHIITSTVRILYIEVPFKNYLVKKFFLSSVIHFVACAVRFTRLLPLTTPLRERVTIMAMPDKKYEILKKISIICTFFFHLAQQFKICWAN
jgi:hypothetical protein